MSKRLMVNPESKREADAMFLTKEDLVHLTGRHQRSSQAQVLRAMGIEHRVRPDGHVVVLRSHVEFLFGAEANHRSTGEPIPDWGAA